MTSKQRKKTNADIFARGFKSKAEKMAIAIREELGLTKFSPLNAFDLTEYKGIPTYTFDEILCDDIHEQKKCTLNNDPNVSALYLINKEGKPIILYKQSNSLGRQQSNLMHEIAHILLGHTMPPEWLKLASKFKLPYDNKSQENEAKFLGGCLQLPTPLLMSATKRNMTVEEIAEKYYASIEMVKYRLRISGVEFIRNRQKQS